MDHPGGRPSGALSRRVRHAALSRAGAAWTLRPDGIEIAVRVTPRASRDQLAAGTEAHFAARLTAPPVEGAANAGLVTLIAKHFDVPKRAVILLSGETARLKRLAIAGDAHVLAKIAASLYGREP